MRRAFGMKREETIDFHLQRSWHKVARYYNQAAGAYGSTMATGFVLLSIDMQQGTPSTHLGPSMGMEPRSLVRILKSLEEKELILRKPDPNDGRMVRIHLTESGLQMRDIAKNTVVDFNQLVREQIEEEKLKVFFEVMERINELLDQKIQS